MKKLFVLIVIAALAGGGYWFYRQHKARTEAEQKAKQTTAATVELRTLSRRAESMGEIRPENRLEVKPPIAGRIEELLVREGDTVKRGQVIAWLSSTERASLLDIARAKGEEEIRYWEEIYKATPLIAPLDGTVIVRNLEPGQTVTSGNTVVVIADHLIVVGLVDETDIGSIFEGQRVRVRLDAYPDSAFSGTVKSIAYDSRQVSNVTMYEVDVLPNRLPEYARSGMTATLTFLIERKENVPAVPTAAIQYRQRQPFVLVPSGKNGEPERQSVKTGIRADSFTEITEGLGVGETVLIPQAQISGRRPTSTNPLGTGSARGAGGGRR